jgi:hypothetical protein
MATTVNGKTDTGFPNRLRNYWIVSWSWFWDRDPTHRLEDSEQRMYQLPQKSTQDFSASEMHEGNPAEVRLDSPSDG